MVVVGASPVTLTLWVVGVEDCEGLGVSWGLVSGALVLTILTESTSS